MDTAHMESMQFLQFPLQERNCSELNNQLVMRQPARRTKKVSRYTQVSLGGQQPNAKDTCLVSAQTQTHHVSADDQSKQQEEEQDARQTRCVSEAACQTTAPVSALATHLLRFSNDLLTRMSVHLDAQQQLFSHGVAQRHEALLHALASQHAQQTRRALQHAASQSEDRAAALRRQISKFTDALNMSKSQIDVLKAETARRSHELQHTETRVHQLLAKEQHLSREVEGHSRENEALRRQLANVEEVLNSERNTFKDRMSSILESNAQLSAEFDNCKNDWSTAFANIRAELQRKAAELWKFEQQSHEECETKVSMTRRWLEAALQVQQQEMSARTALLSTQCDEFVSCVHAPQRKVKKCAVVSCATQTKSALTSNVALQCSNPLSLAAAPDAPPTSVERAEMALLRREVETLAARCQHRDAEADLEHQRLLSENAGRIKFLEKESEALANELEGSKRAIRNLQATIDAKDEEFATMEQAAADKIDEKRHKIRELEATLGSANATIAGLDSAVRHGREESSSMQHQLTETTQSERVVLVSQCAALVRLSRNLKLGLELSDRANQDFEKENARLRHDTIVREQIQSEQLNEMRGIIGALQQREQQVRTIQRVLCDGGAVAVS